MTTLIDPDDKTEDLLKKWASLEPDKCRYDEEYGEWRVVYHSVEDHVHYAGRLDHARIQGAVQQCVESRGWLWRIYHAQNRHRRFKPVPGRYTGQVDKPGVEFSAQATNAVDSLLTAYIMALDHESVKR